MFGFVIGKVYVNGVLVRRSICTRAFAACWCAKMAEKYSNCGVVDACAGGAVVSTRPVF